MNIFKIGSPFFNFMSRLADIVILGIVAAVCCIPVVTVGASMSALYYVLLKLARHEEIDRGILPTYFKAFGQNFWKATGLWLIMAVVIALLFVDYNLLYNLDLNNESISWTTLIIMTVILTFIGNYIMPLQAQFENPIRRTLKNSFILSVMNLPRSLALLAVQLSPLLVWIFYPELLFVLLFCNITIIPYLKAEIFVKVFAKYMPEKPTEPVEEREIYVGTPVSAPFAPMPTLEELEQEELKAEEE
ncbi:MAG: DUF624 domain-containing protein [Ruminococcaceae bacterium]|nr:DUF624 domain-containing protein [Oscillospiraceae bacterium]